MLTLNSGRRDENTFEILLEYFLLLSAHLERWEEGREAREVAAREAATREASAKEARYIFYTFPAKVARYIFKIYFLQ